MKVLVIPTATLVSAEIQLKFGSIPSVMTPLQEEPILKKIYHKYAPSFDKIILVTKEKSELVADYISMGTFQKIEMVQVDVLADLGYSVLFGLEYVRSQYGFDNVDQIAVNLGDTLIEDINFSEIENCLLYSFTVESKRWTTFQFNGGKIISISDKNKIEDEQLYYGSFVGAFAFNDVQLFYDELAFAYNHQEKGIDSFYQAISRYNATYDFNFLKTNKWIDVGHIDKYQISNREVKERYFNTIKIDRKRSILTKHSQETEKFRNEIQWYLKLPKKLQYISPRILDYSLDYFKPYVQMEYYGYTNLNELFVYGDHSLGQWAQIFDSILFLTDEMAHYSLALSNEEYKQSILSMYVDKTVTRLQQLESSDLFTRFFAEPICVNGTSFRTLTEYISLISSAVNNLLIDEASCFSIIHGDLCFSNILYDTSSDIIRVIDPRGSFGEYDIYGDSRYDLAKLFHSIDGRYDFIINDLINIQIEENNIDFSVHSAKKHSDIRKIFIDKLSDKGVSVQQIQLIESLLFFSMIPLHKDHPRRQYAMLATAVLLFEKCITK